MKKKIMYSNRGAKKLSKKRWRKLVFLPQAQTQYICHTKNRLEIYYQRLLLHNAFDATRKK